MRNRTIAFVSLLLFLCPIYGINVTKKIITENFTNIKVAGQYKVIIEQKEGPPSITVKGSKAKIDLLQIKCSDKQLSIRSKNKKRSVNSKKHSIIINITMDNIKKLNIMGNTSIYFPTKFITTDILHLIVTGNADLHMTNIESPHLKSDIKGNADIEIKHINVGKLEGNISGNSHVTINQGVINSASLQIKENGSLDARWVETSKLDAKLYGLGDIYCNVLEKLSGIIYGNGHIYYYGAPLLEAKDTKYFTSLN